MERSPRERSLAIINTKKKPSANAEGNAEGKGEEKF
jgi:hypothetical protein